MLKIVGMIAPKPIEKEVQYICSKTGEEGSYSKIDVGRGEHHPNSGCSTPCMQNIFVKFHFR